MVKAAGVLARVKNARRIQQQHGAFLHGKNAYRQGGYACAGKGFGKQLAGAKCSYNMPVAVKILLHDLHTAVQHKAHLPGGAALGKNQGVCSKLLHPRCKAAQKRLQLIAWDRAKQGSAR